MELAIAAAKEQIRVLEAEITRKGKDSRLAAAHRDFGSVYLVNGDINRLRVRLTETRKLLAYLETV